MAIVVDVFTKIVDQSLRSSSDTIEKHFGKSGQKAGEDFAKALSSGMAKSPEARKALDNLADLTGKLRVEQEKLNAVNEKGTATDAQKIQIAERVAKVQRDIARATDAATDAVQRSNVAAGGLLSTMADLSSGTRLGGVIAQTEVLAGRFGGIGLAAGGAIAGVTALTLGVTALGKNLYDMGKAWDDIGDAITARTGKVGQELDDLVDRIGNVSTRVAIDPAALGDIFGQSIQSLRLSGTQLDAMAQKIAELNNLTGEQTNIRKLGEVFRVFRVETEQQIPMLQGLYDVFRKTGIPVNELIDTMQKSGGTLSEFGINAVQAAGFVTVFEQAGISLDSSLKGLRFALKNITEAGVDPREGLQRIITEIQNLIAAGDDLGARDLAEQRFGKGFPDILRAIRENRIELEALPGLVDTTTDSIGNATDATEDFTEKWKKFKNFWSDTLQPVAASFFDWLNDRMTGATEWMIQKVGDMTRAWSDFSNQGFFGPDSVLGRLFRGQGLGDNPSGYTYGGNFGPAAAGNTAATPRLNDSEGGGVRSQPAVVAGANAVLQAFGDQIRGNIGGSRSYNSAPGTHEVGLAMDIPIGPDQMALGDQINAWLQANADKLNIKYTIWRDQGRYAGNPNPSFTAPGHFNHIDVQYNNGSPGTGTIGGSGGSPNGVPLGISINGKPVTTTAVPAPGSAGVPVGPGAAGTPPSDRPSAADVPAASAATTPVQMVPSPFGPTYSPVPAGSTPGYNQYGKPGSYLPDPKQIQSATDRYQDSLDGINAANDQIKDAKERQAEAAQEAAKVEQDFLSTSEERKRAQDKLKSANDAVAAAVKAADRANKNADDAQEALAEAKRGTFREAQKAQQAKAAQMGELGAGLANDMGISEGLPGIAKWWTTALANMAFAPMMGQLSAISAAGPIKGGSGLLGMMGAQNLASTGQLFPGLGPVVGPGTTTSDSIPAMLSNGEYVLSANDVNAMGGVNGVQNVIRRANGGPVTDTQSLPPAPGQGAGFQGVGGLALTGIQAATAGLDMLAPGAGQAAQIGIQLANRTAGYMGQLAGIGVGGLLETFLPHGSPLASPEKSWLGKIAGGLAGARPAMPNTAGQMAGQGGGEPAPPMIGQPAPPQTPEQAAALNQQHGAGGGGAPGPMVHVENMVNQTPDAGQTIANQVGRLMMSSYASGMPR